MKDGLKVLTKRKVQQNKILLVCAEMSYFDSGSLTRDQNEKWSMHLSNDFLSWMHNLTQPCIFYLTWGPAQGDTDQAVNSWSALLLEFIIIHITHFIFFLDSLNEIRVELDPRKIKLTIFLFPFFLHHSLNSEVSIMQMMPVSSTISVVSLPKSLSCCILWLLALRALTTVSTCSFIPLATSETGLTCYQV